MSNNTSQGVRRYTIILGSALFAMFFGAGNLIFPPTLGRLSGNQFGLSTIGFLLTGVGLPLMGILAVAKSQGGIDQFAKRVGSRVAKLLAVTIMLAIGPLLAVPRTCATTYELGIAPNIPWLNSWLFSFLFFGAVIFFVLNPLSVVDRIGKILTPVLVITLLAFIIRGIIKPIAAPADVGNIPAFGKGFFEGYQTMDLIGASVMGIIILNELRSKGIVGKVQQMLIITKAGLISATGLAVIYSGLLYLGATSSGAVGELSRTELLLTISERLMGSSGAVILALAVSTACLTTAIALTMVCGEYFNLLSRGKFSYKGICIAVSIVSFVLSNAGVEWIVKVSRPLLSAVYPVVIVLVILTFTGKNLARRGIWQGAVIGAFAVGLMDALRSLGLESSLMNAVYNSLPLAQYGLGWLIPAIVCGTLGGFSPEKKVPVPLNPIDFINENKYL